ncbi:MAG: Asp-tRNA(Asn)/Glu-tRNA(Gln) amidotransferase subunit GatA [Planctomycetes bacterium]|nr:Asp-tRNA(Asn)/Glu-tRNA(Gln) amidotransferase subunit GatA [Planctomycetota bacterium]
MGSTWTTAAEIRTRVVGGESSATDICGQSLARIDAGDSEIRAFLEVTREHATLRARALDADRAAGGPLGLLAGVPLAVKDNICTRFARTTCASQALAEYRPPFDAAVIERAERAGAVIVGKTNLDEFAMGSSTEYGAFGLSRNPWNLECVPGGSSGGSAAAVAAGFVPVALGSDTGGSVRQPAAFCGVVGLKPTYGRVSRFGLVAYGSSLDQVGTMARTVGDAAALLEVIAGPDPRDSTCLTDPMVDLGSRLSDAALADAARKLRIGIPREFFGAGLDPEVEQAVRGAIAVYQRLGAALIDVSLPSMPHAVAVYYLIATAECSSNLARFDGVHYGHRTSRPPQPRANPTEHLYSASRAEGFGAEAKRRIILGTFALSAGYADKYYGKALQVRRLLNREMQDVLSRVDVLIGPTTPTAAFRIGEKSANPLQIYLADTYTIVANLCGVPAISIPCGFARCGLPIGMQLMAPHLGEPALVQAARLYERETDWHNCHPPAFQ